jgi:hypothetical protein
MSSSCMGRSLGRLSVMAGKGGVGIYLWMY